jgi:CDP-paratose 2-epimerase
MKVLITGICGFAGSSIAFELLEHCAGMEIFGIDNLCRPGSELNRSKIKERGISFVHGDVRNASDIESLPKSDWVIDAAANPSVLAGIAGSTSSRQLMEHNLGATLPLLEHCKQHGAGLIMLSTSRVYSQLKLSALPVEVEAMAFKPKFSEINEPGLTPKGVAEDFSTQPPLSLYGAAKLASEILILEYGSAFGFPVQINRCGVLAGAGQFGKPDQGIFTFWIHSCRYKKPLKYIGFGGEGCQARDCLHPKDLASLIALQIQAPKKEPQVLNVSGGVDNMMSLAQLTDWCAVRFGKHAIGVDAAPRRYDVPWLALDSSFAEKNWGWRASIRLEQILEEIALHADKHPEWLELSTGA